MKKVLLPLFSALLIVFGSPMVGIGQIAYNGFEEDAGDTWTATFSTAPCTNGADSWDYRTDLSTLDPPPAGSQFWGITDLNGNCGGSGFESITFATTNVAAYTGVTIAFDYKVIGFDNNDDFKYEVFEDGTGQGEVVFVDGSSNLNAGWSTITINITPGTTTVGFKLMARQNGGDYGGWDNVILDGTSAGTTYDITVTQATGGTIAPGTATVIEGNDQAFTATPDDCYTFTNWIVDGSGAGSTNPYTFTNVTAAHTITAVYTAVSTTNDIVASAGANGSISPSGTTTLGCGADQSYTITPDVGYGVLDVLVDGVSQGAITSYDFTGVDAAHTISATFGQVPCASVDFTDSGNSGSYATVNWTHSSVDWRATDARGDQDLNGSEAVTLRNGSLTNETSVAGGCGTLSFDYARVFSGNSTLKVFVNGTQYGGDLAVSNTTSTPFSIVVNQTGNIDVELQNNGNRTVINNLQWSCYAPTEPPVNLSVSANAGTEAGTTAITVTATADFAVTGAQTVDLAVSGTGITAGDYTLSGTTITIADGATTGSVTFTVVDDAANEGTETATLTISSPSAGVTLGSTTTQDIAITDNDAPLIVASPTSLTGFSTPQGTASASQTFTLEGDNLSGNLSIAALTGFEYSLDDATFTSTLTVPVSGGNVTGEPRTIYVRLTGATIGTPSGNAVVSGGGATSVNVALDGTVTTPPLTACSELFISEYHEAASGNEKYVEVYNPTASAITLAGTYAIVKYNNGSSSVGGTLALTGSVAAYSAVYIANSGATLSGSANATDGNVTTFNGNDVIALRKNGTNIDVVGTIGSSANFGLNVVLRRKAAIDVPTTTYNAGEWNSSGSNDVSDLGVHTSDCAVALPSVTLTINTATGTEAGTTAITLTATADAAVTGDQTVEVTLSGTGLVSTDFTGVDFTSTVNITILGGATVGTLTFNIANDTDVEGDETATFTIGSPSGGVIVGTPNAETLVITDDDNVTSTESVIDEQGGEAANISSLTNGTITNNTQGTQVWKFNLHDGDGSADDADSKPTIYEGFTIRQSGGNTVPAWDDAINNVKFFLGASATPISGSFLVSPSTITFTPTTPITVADGTTPAAISMRITLDAVLPAGSDGQNFGFSLDDSDVTVETDVLLASQLGTFTETSNAGLNGINIDATLQFINAPSGVSIGDNFTVTVSAIDANGNIDTDVSAAITLTLSSGAGTLTGVPVTNNLAGGTFTFTGLSHDTEETIQITATGGGYSSVNATIVVSDEPHQLFDDFNRTNNNVVGVPSSETVTSYTETGTGNGSRSRIEDNQLLLANCNNGSGSGGSNGMEQVMFNVENRHETVYDNAGSLLEWVFNMNQNRSNPSGFGSNTYAAGMVLGSTTLDVEAGSANGYAVIIGNGGNPDPVKLVRYANGLTNNSNVSDVAVSTQNSDESHFSVKVTYNPCDGEWSLYVRDDGSSFADPNVGSLGSAFTGTDQTHTASDLKFFGMVWQHGVSCTETAVFDNVNIPNATSATTTDKIWNGSVNNDWNEANNWGPCPGAPTATDNVVIPTVTTTPVVGTSPNAVCTDLTIEAGGVLTINPSFVVNMSGVLDNEGTMNVESSGSLVQATGSTLIGAGTFNVRRQGITGSAYNYWSSPIQSGTVPGNNIYRYDSNIGTQDFSDDTPADPGWQSFSGAMTVGKGYAASGGGSATFTGTANNGDLSFGLDYNALNVGSLAPGTPYNLVGNPYPSAISATALVNAAANSSVIDGALYFWNDDLSAGADFTSSDYAVWNGTGSTGTGAGSTPPDGNIASCQGFMVRALGPGAISFNNSMRVGAGNNGLFFRPAVEPAKIWLSVTGDNTYNEILVGMLAEATDSQDRLYDALKLNANPMVSLSAVNDGDDFAIMAFPHPQQEKVIPLNLLVGEGGTHTFQAHTMLGFDNYTVYLEDNLASTLVELTEGVEVQADVVLGDNPDRFYLHFVPNLVTGVDETLTSELRVYGNLDQTFIDFSGNQTAGNLEVLSANGQLLFTQEANLGNAPFVLNTRAYAAGVYIVKFTTGNKHHVARFSKF